MSTLKKGEGGFEDITDKVNTELDRSKTHVTMFNNVAFRLSKWVSLEVDALRKSKEVYRMMGNKEDVIVLIDRRIVEVNNLIEELNECGESIAKDFTSIFTMLGGIIFEEEEGDNDDNDFS